MNSSPNQPPSGQQTGKPKRQSASTDDSDRQFHDHYQRYWSTNRRLLGILLLLWFLFALGCTVLFTDWLDQFTLGGFRLGFWFTQQGSILFFVAIIFVYHLWMNRIEHRYEIGPATIDSGSNNNSDGAAKPVDNDTKRA